MLGLIIGAAIASHIADTVRDAVKANEKVQLKTTILADGAVVSLGHDELAGRNYRDVINILLGFGFRNIHVQEIRKYNDGFFTKKYYGTVESVSINGIRDFKKDSVFPKTSYINVAFHLFKDSPPVVIPELAFQDRKEPDHGKNGPFGYKNPEDPAPERREEEKIMYCEYCDSLIMKGSIKCPHCGAPVSRGTMESADSAGGNRKYCNQCGSRIRIRSRFCDICGARINY